MNLMFLDMASSPFILFPGPSAWRLGAVDDPDSAPIDVPVPRDAAPADIAVAVGDALRRAGYGGEGVLLAIPSAWCLCAEVTTSGLPARNRHQALTYRFEDKLPVAAEEVIADFLPFGPSDDETLGVCALKTTIAPIVDALESNGVAVAAICPAALLALQSLRNGELPEIAAADAVAWPGEQEERRADTLELFTLRAGRVRCWSVLPDEPKDLLLHLSLEFPQAASAAGNASSIAAIGLRQEIHSTLSPHPGLRLIDLQMPAPLAAAMSLAGAILAGKVLPWIDLRRDELAVRDPFRQVRTPLTFAAVAVAVCLLCLCGGMLWRANRYDRMAAQYAGEQQAVFHQAFPNVAVPGDVRSRLAAEERSLHGMSGDASAPVPQESGLVALRDLLAHLPAGNELRYRVLEIRLDPGRFTLEGQAAAHGDADLIVAALRRGKAFVVEPPLTEQLGGSAGAGEAADKAANSGAGVAFTITGAVVAEPPTARRGAK
jgi:hypothetical protein